MERLNLIREKALKPFLKFEEIYKGTKTTAEFIYKYYEFLSKESGLGKSILALAKEQQKGGFPDLAEETLQIWDSIMEAFQQIHELVGDEKFSGKELLLMLESGLSQMEVGVLPPTADDILLGNMQRTRCGDIKALLVIGANEGILPLAAGNEVLFSNDEIDRLREEGRELGISEDLRHMEENLAIYRNLSKPSDYLYMSYSLSDVGGEKSLPSQFFERMREIFPKNPVLEDVLNRDDIRDRLGGEINTLRHFTEAMKEAGKGQKISGDWKAVEDWLLKKEERKEKLLRVRDALAFDNVQDPIPGDLAADLFHRDEKRLGDKDFSFSPSRLEKYSRCPFYHFVSYGLRPKEQRIYTAAAREIGDLYHDVLMDFSLRMNKEGSWGTIDKTASDALVEELVNSRAEEYRQGLFNNSNNEKYWLGRAKEVCRNVCWNLIEQMRLGRVENSFYEEAFMKEGESEEETVKTLPPIVKAVEGGTVYIEGRIDRFDILPGEKVKIIDYKSGKEYFKAKEAAGGYRLQLMLYLKAALEDEKKPAGVFYFLISDPKVNAGKDAKELSREEVTERVKEKVNGSFRLNGIMVDNKETIRDMAGDFEGYSTVLPLYCNKEGGITPNSNKNPFLLSEKDFKRLQEEVDKVTEDICKNILEGKIDIRPKKANKKTPCTYCDYKGICRFDLSFKGCKYEEIGDWEPEDKPEEKEKDKAKS